MQSGGVNVALRRRRSPEQTLRTSPLLASLLAFFLCALAPLREMYHLLMRLDQWLWAVRLYQTRSLAVEAIKGGHVKVNGEPAKPAHEMKPGELVTARTGSLLRTLRVLDAPRSRVSAKLVAQYAEDLTPPEEFEKQRAVEFRPVAARPRGSGRPTKRERRLLDGWAGEGTDA